MSAEKRSNRYGQDQEELDQKKEERTEKKLLLLLLLLLLFFVITICSIGITVWTLFFREPDIVLTPDYAPKDEEINQIPIQEEKNDKMESEEGGGAVSLTYSSYVTVDLSDELAVLMFANPGKSTKDMVIQIVIQGEVIVQSGRLLPGNKVTALKLLDGVKKKLPIGGYDGKFVVFYYDSLTGEKSVVNTEIPISISVVE